MEDFSPLKAFEPLSTRDLSILEEQLSQETLIMLKLIQYSKQCQDSGLKNLCSKLAKKHKNHYDSLLNYLVSHTSDN